MMFHLHSSKITQRITFVMILLIVVSSVIIGGTVSLYSGNMFKQNSYAQIVTIQEQLTKNINTCLNLALQQFLYLEIDPDFIEIASKKSQDDMPFLEQYVSLRHLFSKYRSQQSGVIDSILFYRSDGELFSEYLYDSHADGIDAAFLEKARKNYPAPVWCYPGVTATKMSSGEEKEYITLFCAMEHEGEEIGVLIFNIKVSALKSIFDDIAIKPSEYKMLVCNEKKEVIVSFGNKDIKGIDWEKAETGKYPDESEIKNNSQFVISSPVEFGGFSLVTVFAGSLITNQYRLIMKCLLYCCVICFLSFIIIAYIVSGAITRPLTDFANSIRPVIGGDYDVRFNYPHDDEIGILSDVYNRMLDRTKYLMQEIKTERELKARAELNSLLQQINAHFLYNTLDIIYWMSKNNDGETAAELTASLSELLRISVSGGKEIISVKSEITHLKKYLYIQNFRYEFDYEINVEDEILNYGVPKLILQPLAENSILHGFESITYRGKITVNGFFKDGRIIFEVEDNGSGIDSARVHEYLTGSEIDFNENSHYALSNIYTRFKLLYGRDDCIYIESPGGRGTKVTLKLPVI